MDIEKVIDGLAKESEQAATAEDGDYLQNGILYCGKCHTAKQLCKEVFGRKRILNCLCQCAVEQRAQAAEEQRQRDLLDDIKRMRSVGFPDRELSQWNFGRDDGSNPKMTAIARKYAENFAMMKVKGKGLLLYGTVGTGKTFMSACIANALLDQGVPCLVTNFARLANTLQGMWEGRQEYIDSLDNYSLLVIDDLASERDTEYMGELIQNIIDARYRSGKPLIVTTNLTKDDLRHPPDIRRQRIYSRLFEMCIPIEVTGEDRRKVKAGTDYAQMRGLLGL